MYILHTVNTHTHTHTFYICHELSHQIFHDMVKQVGIFIKGLINIRPPELPQFLLADLHQVLDVFMHEDFEDLVHHSLKPKNTIMDFTQPNYGC